MYLSGEVCGSALRHLEDDWGLVVASSLKSSYNGGGRGDILVDVVSLCLLFCLRPAQEAVRGTHDSGDRKVVFLGIVEELEDIIANDDTSLASENVLNTHGCGSSSMYL